MGRTALESTTEPAQGCHGISSPSLVVPTPDEWLRSLDLLVEGTPYHPLYFKGNQLVAAFEPWRFDQGAKSGFLTLTLDKSLLEGAVVTLRKNILSYEMHHVLR